MGNSTKEISSSQSNFARLVHALRRLPESDRENAASELYEQLRGSERWDALLSSTPEGVFEHFDSLVEKAKKEGTDQHIEEGFDENLD